MRQQLIAAPTLACVDLAAAKLHCRVDVADDDSLITGMIAAAQEEAEAIMHRAILTQQWRLFLDAFDACDPVIPLRPATVASVDAVKYVDVNGALQTLVANTDYQASVGDRLRSRLAPAYGKAWPTTRAQMDAVQIDVTCGWTAANAVPQVIRQWVLMRVGAYYENREAWTQGRPIERNSFVDRLLDRWTVPVF